MTGAPVTNLTKVEREVIGCIMGSERAVSEALEMLRDDDLQTGACRLILQAARAISARGHQVDLMSVTAWLKENHPKIEKIEVNLAAMALDGCSESHLGYRLAALVEGASLRHIRQGLDETTKMAKSAVPGNGTVEEVLDSLSELTLSGRSTKGMERSMGIGEAVQLGFDELQEAQDHQDAPGFRTGVPALDEIWGGMRRGEVVIVAGATGLGKSLFAANLVLSAAGTEWEWLGWRRANTMLVCTEMRLPDVAKRLIALRGNIDMSRVRDGRLDESERTAARDAADWMRDLPLQIDARGKVSIGRVMRMARSEKRAGKLDLLVVDLVTHIRHEGRIDSREQQVAQVSQELSDLAVDLDIPIVLTCQVNRAVQQRGDKEPQTDDLRYSAALGHDASIVSFLWRQKDWPGLRTDITTTKNRNGSLGTASLRRVPRFAQFTSWEPDMATQGQFV